MTDSVLSRIQYNMPAAPPEMLVFLRARSRLLEAALKDCCATTKAIAHAARHRQTLRVRFVLAVRRCNPCCRGPWPTTFVTSCCVLAPPIRLLQLFLPTLTAVIGDLGCFFQPTAAISLASGRASCNSKLSGDVAGRPSGCVIARNIESLDSLLSPES